MGQRPPSWKLPWGGGGQATWGLPDDHSVPQAYDMRGEVSEAAFGVGRELSSRRAL